MNLLFVTLTIFTNLCSEQYNVIISVGKLKEDILLQP